MTDNRTTELTAIERLRTMLDERGVEWRKWTKGQVETKWFVPNGMTEFDSHFCSASVSKDHREGPLHYKGYVISPQAAIEASLGKADNASANAGDICELSELRDLACDINAAEIIDHVRITHRGWTFDSRWLDSWHMEFDRIADELEQAIAATLSRPKAKAHPYGYEPDTGAFDCTRCECGCINDISAAYCNDCGGEIEIDMYAEKEIYRTPRHLVFAEKHDDGSLEFGWKRYVAATLGSGTCEYVIEDNMNESEGMGDVWFRCTNCNTCYDYYADDWLLKMPYCPNCGAKIVQGVDNAD